MHAHSGLRVNLVDFESYLLANALTALLSWSALLFFRRDCCLYFIGPGDTTTAVTTFDPFDAGNGGNAAALILLSNCRGGVS